jgi:hypothetical protein
MIDFKLEIPGDFEDRLRKQLEDKIAHEIRMAGISGVTVRLERDGTARFNCPDGTADKVREALKKMSK